MTRGRMGESRTMGNGRQGQAKAGASCRPLVLAALIGLGAMAGGATLAPQPALATADIGLSPFAQSLAIAAASDPALAEYYRDSNYAAVWTDAGPLAAERRVALFRALNRAWTHGLPSGRFDTRALEQRLARVRTEGERARAEVALSRAYLAYADAVGSGVLTPTRVDKQLVREVPHRDPQLLMRGIAGAAPAAYLRGLPPQAPEYAQLMKARFDLQQLIAAGGWGARVPEGAYRPGDAGAGVVALRDRLIAMGYLGRTATARFDGEMQRAVQAFQAEHGLASDGIAGASTVQEINVGPEERLHSVLAAMERMRWMNGVTLGERHVWVNLPDFTAKLVDHGEVTFQTVSVIGMNQSDRRTPEFSDEMEYMVVNPTWNVPRSITVKEYLPMMQKNPNAAGQLQLYDRSGRPVAREQVDFAAYTPGNFPYVMKQPPSDGNALGLVKFMFPNKWNIYLHDTPSKSLFLKETRAFSHGCIRLQRPFDFAYALLAAQTDDPEALFKRTLATKRETVLRLDRPVPVHLVYFTAWPAAKGRIEYRRDIYGRDAEIFRELEEAGLALGRVEG